MLLQYLIRMLNLHILNHHVLIFESHELAACHMADGGHRCDSVGIQPRHFSHVVPVGMNHK